MFRRDLSAGFQSLGTEFPGKDAKGSRDACCKTGLGQRGQAVDERSLGVSAGGLGFGLRFGNLVQPDVTPKRVDGARAESPRFAATDDAVENERVLAERNHLARARIDDAIHPAQDAVALAAVRNHYGTKTNLTSL